MPARQHISTDPRAGIDAAKSSRSGDSAIGAGRREAADRRGRDRNRNRHHVTASGAVIVNDRFMLPATWWFAPLIYAGGGAFLIAFSNQFPGVLAALSLMASTAIAAAGIRVSAWERSAPRQFAKALALAAGCTLPASGLFGLAAAMMHSHSGLSATAMIGILLCVMTLLGTLLSGRTEGLYGNQLTLWLPVVALSGNTTASAAYGIAVITTYLVIKLQRRTDLARARRREERNRVSRRAQDILTDYEQAGQGWFWETDRRGQISYISPSIADLFGMTPEKIVGRPFTALFDVGNDSREGDRTISFHLSARSGFSDLAVRASSKLEERWWSVTGRPIYDSYHNFCGFRGSGSDLTAKKRSEEHASRLAMYDSLTGLANRFQMSQILEKILAAPIERDRECSVLLLDLDRFKQVNDTLGHPAGDALLKLVATRLERAVGKKGRVGRLGGDEFNVILPGRSEEEALTELAKTIIHSLSQPYHIDGNNVVIGASIGIAMSPVHGTTSDDLVRNSDLALYAAKDGGRGRSHVYSSDLHSAAEERSNLEQDLRDAVTNGGFELHYQPVVSAATEKVTGFEALLRWHHPVKGWLSPAKFIPIAEDAGLIRQIGEWVLRTACRDLADWPQDVRCAVNVSTLQFADKSFPAIVTNALAQSQVDPARLELEITESVFLTDNANTDAIFAALKKIGVRLALDDFGTGYSSLGYLKKAPFDKIKIDQSFVRGATQKGSRNGAIISSITSLAQSLGMDTTAEGVETLDELNLVRVLGCSHIQGYIYEKAMTAQAARNRLSEGLTFTASGPQSTRMPRKTMLRKILLECQETFYNGTIRNISETGALVEGISGVPDGTVFKIAITPELVVQAASRWCLEDRMGVEFAQPLERRDDGSLVPDMSGPSPGRTGLLREAG